MSEPIVVQTHLPEGMIDLGMGNPDLSLLPIETVHQSVESYFQKGDHRALQYGTEQGNEYFRIALAKLLSEQNQLQVSPDELLITNGASISLDLLCTQFTSPGDVVFVEEPTYFLSLKIFRDHGLKPIPIPMNEDGLQIDELVNNLQKYQPKFLYTIPVFQNPSGITLSQERRDQIVELAQEFDFLIIADEVYHLLQYEKIPPRPFADDVKTSSHVISLNSFSKILAPGLRLGWLHAPKAIREKIILSGLFDSGGGLNPFTSALMLDMVKSGGLSANINNLRLVYKQRRDALTKAVLKNIPNARFTVPDGGFFLWVEIPSMDTAKLRQKARENFVDIRDGRLFSSQDNLKHFLRLCFCYYEPKELEEGIIRLCKTIKNL